MTPADRAELLRSLGVEVLADTRLRRLARVLAHAWLVGWAARIRRGEGT